MDTNQEKKRIKVLFVCLGNICRSPAAEGVMKALVEEAGQADRWEIDSAGTGNYHVGDLPDRRMRIAARNRGITLDHICRQVKPYDFEHFDIIIAMDESNYRNLRDMSPTAETDAKLHRMSEFFSGDVHSRHTYVPDPYYEGAEGFELVLDLLADGCANLMYEMADGFNCKSN